jgi:isopentenyl-diphosphate delta-isomerase
VLVRSGVRAVDVGGLGGTSFSAVEVFRAEEAHDAVRARVGRTFWDWGIPTPIALSETREAVGDKVEIVATGGIRNGLDAARALAFGADAVGIGGAMFKAAAEGEDAAVAELGLIIEELKTALFLTGCLTLDQLWRGEVVL